MPPTPPLSRLYWIANPSEFTTETAFFNAIAVAVQAGVGMIQYRDKAASPDRALAHIMQIAQLINQHEKQPGRQASKQTTQLIINDSHTLWHTVQVQHGILCGLHLGVKDTAPSQVLAQSPRPSCLGVSCYNALSRAQQAAQAGVDYVSFGAFFPSTTKPEAKPAEIALLAAAKQHLSCPIVAIGGITPENAAELCCAGADYIAVAGALNRSKDLQHTLAEFTDCLTLS